MIKNTLMGLAAVAAVFGAPAMAEAPQQPFNIDSALMGADFVFEGVVEQVNFRLSEMPPGTGEGVPHTFVTYRIGRIFKGNHDSDLLTLRFIGGKRDADRLMLASINPLMDIGDRDIVFVKDNGTAICPMMSCPAGRLRVIDGAVYSEDGNPVQTAALGEVLYGPRQEFIEVALWEAGGIGRRFDKSTGRPTGGDDGHDATSDATPVPGMSGQKLAGQIRKRISQLYTPAQLAQLPPVVTLNPNQPFLFQPPQPVAPDPAPVATAAETAADAEDPEMALARANSYDPVLHTK